MREASKQYLLRIKEDMLAFRQNNDEIVLAEAEKGTDAACCLIWKKLYENYKEFSIDDVLRTHICIYSASRAFKNLLDQNGSDIIKDSKKANQLKILSAVYSYNLRNDKKISILYGDDDSMYLVFYDEFKTIDEEFLRVNTSTGDGEMHYNYSIFRRDFERLVSSLEYVAVADEGNPQK